MPFVDLYELTTPPWPISKKKEKMLMDGLLIFNMLHAQENVADLLQTAGKRR
jgi:hypothetical protein